MDVNKVQPQQLMRNGYLELMPQVSFHNIDRTTFILKRTKEEILIEAGSYPMVGRGNFGLVLKWEYKGKIFAIKRSVGECPVESEIKMMTLLPHHTNIIQFIGISTCQPPMILMDYYSNGSLEQYYRNGIETIEATSIMKDIGNGMVVVTKHQIVHRDLAARNILIDNQGIAKIADFGLAKQFNTDEAYVAKEVEILPVRLLAPECILDLKFSEKSDVWSYGVLMFELFTNGQRIFEGMKDEEIAVILASKNLTSMHDHMKQLDDCPMFDVMKLCWKVEHYERPSFSQIGLMIMDILGNME